MYTISKVLPRATRQCHLQAYYAKDDEKVEMNKMRYPKSNAKDDAEHSHPTELSSAAVHANFQKSPLLPVEHHNIKNFVCIFVVVAYLSSIA